MVSFKNLSLLALAGSAIAAPAPNRGYGGKHVVWHTVVHTAYVTVYPGQSKPTPPAEAVYEQKPAPTTSKKVVEVPKPKPTPSPSSSSVYVAPPEPTPSTTQVYEEPKPEPTPEPSPSPTPDYPEPEPEPEPETPPPTNTGYMGIVDEWRGKLGLSTLAHDAQLEANAKKTCREGNGQMVHQLNSGSMGQVLAPGGPDEFYHVFVGGWLCEKPNMPGMDGICEEASKGWYYTSTGHADILISPNYSKIGCAEAGGIWGCDLA